MLTFLVPTMWLLLVWNGNWCWIHFVIAEHQYETRSWQFCSTNTSEGFFCLCEFIYLRHRDWYWGEFGWEAKTRTQWDRSYEIRYHRVLGLENAYVRRSKLWVEFNFLILIAFLIFFLLHFFHYCWTSIVYQTLGLLAFEEFDPFSYSLVSLQLV